MKRYYATRDVRAAGDDAILLGQPVKQLLKSTDNDRTASELQSVTAIEDEANESSKRLCLMNGCKVQKDCWKLQYTCTAAVNLEMPQNTGNFSAICAIIIWKNMFHIVNDGLATFMELKAEQKQFGELNGGLVTVP